ncbi:uncharacterized protein LOC122301776 [Carya illinoinensis]|uniref:uncharacterized protein LOC122301776 n=1 Tax=Carya illinoinensis TaxID=32201 RepID=UPI001C719AAC|nr:uncharacterized protein LOC122301776 [Carya illinoinensis]
MNEESIVAIGVNEEPVAVLEMDPSAVGAVGDVTAIDLPGVNELIHNGEGFSDSAVRVSVEKEIVNDAPFVAQEMEVVLVEPEGGIDEGKLFIEDTVEGLELQSQFNWDENFDRDLHVANAKLATWHRREEIRLSQMVKLKWVTDGDRNSRFFHTCLALKRSKWVLSMRSNDAMFESPEGIHQGAIDYFSSFLQGEPPAEQPNFDGLIDPVISEEEDVSLVSAPSLEEVFAALSSIPVNSTPGLDGFGFGFYKSCWEVVKNDLWKAVLELF